MSDPSRTKRKTLQKYLVFQVPGAIMVGMLLVGLCHYGFLSLAMSVFFFVAWCTKDAVMYRFVRSAYEPGPPHGTAALIGQRGVVVADLAPTGSVRLGAERWSARVAEGSASLGQGTRVRVVAVEGYVVAVVRDGDPQEIRKPAH